LITHLPDSNSITVYRSTIQVLVAFPPSPLLEKISGRQEGVWIA